MEIGKNDLAKLIIDRSKSTDEVDKQIDFSANEFQKLEEKNEGSELVSDREEEIIPTGAEIGVQLHEREAGRPKSEERPKSKRRENHYVGKRKWI